MAWFQRYTRFADMHYVYGQERGMSCGLACVTMAVFKVNKLVPGIAAQLDEDQIMRTYNAIMPNADKPMSGTYPEPLVKVLDALTGLR